MADKLKMSSQISPLIVNKEEYSVTYKHDFVTFIIIL